MRPRDSGCLEENNKQDWTAKEVILWLGKALQAREEFLTEASLSPKRAIFPSRSMFDGPGPEHGPWRSKFRKNAVA